MEVFIFEANFLQTSEYSLRTLSFQGNDISSILKYFSFNDLGLNSLGSHVSCDIYFLNRLWNEIKSENVSRVYMKSPDVTMFVT